MFVPQQDLFSLLLVSRRIHTLTLSQFYRSLELSNFAAIAHFYDLLTASVPPPKASLIHHARDIAIRFSFYNYVDVNHPTELDDMEEPMRREQYSLMAREFVRMLLARTPRVESLELEFPMADTRILVPWMCMTTFVPNLKCLRLYNFCTAMGGIFESSELDGGRAFRAFLRSPSLKLRELWIVGFSQLHSADWNALADYQAQHLEELVIRTSQPYSAEIARIIAKAPRLTTLNIMSPSSSGPPQEPVLLMNDNSLPVTFRDRILAALSARTKRKDACALVRLQLDRFGLFASEQVLLEAVHQLAKTGLKELVMTGTWIKDAQRVATILRDGASLVDVWLDVGASAEGYDHEWVRTVWRDCYWLKRLRLENVGRRRVVLIRVEQDMEGAKFTRGSFEWVRE